MSDPMTTIEGDRADVRVGHFHEGIMVSVGKRPKRKGDATQGAATILTPAAALNVIGALTHHLRAYEED